MTFNKLSLALLLWIRVLIFGLIYAILGVTSSLSLEDIAPYWPVIFIIGNLIMLSLFDFILKRQGHSYRQFIGDIFQKPLQLKDLFYTSLWMSGLGVGGMILISLMFFQGPPPDLIYSVPWLLGMFYAILFPLTAALSELPFYFGYIYTSWKGSRSSEWLWITYIILVYGIQHALLPLLWDVKFILFRIVSFIPLMILIAINYRRRRSLRSMIVIHGLMDFFTILQMII